MDNPNAGNNKKLTATVTAELTVVKTDAEGKAGMCFFKLGPFPLDSVDPAQGFDITFMPQAAVVEIVERYGKRAFNVPGEGVLLFGLCTFRKAGQQHTVGDVIVATCQVWQLVKTAGPSPWGNLRPRPANGPFDHFWSNSVDTFHPNGNGCHKWKIVYTYPNSSSPTLIVTATGKNCFQGTEIPLISEETTYTGTIPPMTAAGVAAWFSEGQLEASFEKINDSDCPCPED